MPRPDFLLTILEFQQRFGTEEACREYLFASRWPDGFTCQAFEWFEERGIAIERLMTDNHFSCTKSLALAELLDGRRASHLTIRPYTPRTNGKVERFPRR